jgi:methylenetetrahydrofolate dehydrogenase (NADP+)/methenyltetrahydrofolate cyclohydrolase
MIIDGRKIAERIKKEIGEGVAALGRRPALAVVMVGDNPISLKYINIKKKFGEEAGVDVKVFNFPEDISEEDLRRKISEIGAEKNDGIIVQLPLPLHINTQSVLDCLDKNKDADMLSSASMGDFADGRSLILPPVVGAIKEILNECKVEPRGKNVVIFGFGRLVGRPANLWFAREGATVSVINEFTTHPAEMARQAEIIVSGVGQAKLITDGMVRVGAVVIDAGAAMLDAKIVGDVDFEAVKDKAAFITPVPGGVGPVTVAMVFKNLLTLIKV